MEEPEAKPNTTMSVLLNGAILGCPPALGFAWAILAKACGPLLSPIVDTVLVVPDVVALLAGLIPGALAVGFVSSCFPNLRIDRRILCTLATVLAVAAYYVSYQAGPSDSACM